MFYLPNVQCRIVQATAFKSFSRFLRFCVARRGENLMFFSLLLTQSLASLTVQITRAAKKELYAMKQLSHDNVNRFIGACIEPGHVAIVTQYCSRGSLRVSTPDLSPRCLCVCVCSLIDGPDLTATLRPTCTSRLCCPKSS